MTNTNTTETGSVDVDVDVDVCTAHVHATVHRVCAITLPDGTTATLDTITLDDRSDVHMLPATIELMRYGHTVAVRLIDHDGNRVELHMLPATNELIADAAHKAPKYEPDDEAGK